MIGFESLLTGRSLADRYRVEEVIGRGGMGAVYRAIDERLDRTVAVKVISVTAPTADMRDRLRARFHREARAAARLHHPNVVTIYDYGTDPRLGLDYLTMEFLKGEDLATFIERVGPAPVPLSCLLLHEAARGLAAGHRIGLIHRDVKPGNIFICSAAEDERGRALVLDFGIAQIPGDQHTVTHLTQFGHHPLSPAYASPEQLRRDPNLGPRTDVFSLAATGYHLLTGERFSVPDDPRRTRREISRVFANTRERRVSCSQAMEGALEEIVSRGLAHDPADRFEDATEFAKALEQVLREDTSNVVAFGIESPLLDLAPAAATVPASRETPQVQVHAPRTMSRVPSRNGSVLKTLRLVALCYLAVAVIWLYNQPISRSPAVDETEVNTGQPGDWFIILGSYSKQRRDEAEQLLDRLRDRGYKVAQSGSDSENPLADYSTDWRDQARIIDSDRYPSLRRGLWVVVLGPYQKEDAEALARETRQRSGIEAYIKSSVR